MKISELAGIVVVIGTLCGWGFYLGNRLTKIDDRMGYVENFLKQHYRTFVTTDVESLDRQVSPVIQASQDTKAAVGTLVNLDPTKNTVVVYNPKTDATDTLQLTPNVQTFVYVPALRRYLRMSASALPPGAAIAAVRPSGGGLIDKIYTSSFNPIGLTAEPSEPLGTGSPSARPSPSPLP